MKVKRTKHDDIFSKVIRERDEYTCQRCKRTADTTKIECSHFFSRRHQATRYDPDNACAHCFTCHQYLGENPILFQSWIRSYLGDVRYSELVEKHYRTKKWLKAEKEEMYQHYREQLKELELQRAEGAVGQLSLVAFE